MSGVVDRFQTVVSGLRGLVQRRSIPVRAAVDPAPRAMVVMSEGSGRDALEGVFRDAGWKLAVADNSGSAIMRQKSEAWPIILYERELTDNGWRQAVSLFSRLSPHPFVVLLSRSSDNNLWDELIRCGGFDLLRTPIDRDAVIKTVSAGWAIWQNWHSRHQVAETIHS